MDEATVEVVVRPAIGVPTTTEKLQEQLLRTAIEPVILGGMMPRTLVQIVVQIVKDDGSVRNLLFIFVAMDKMKLFSCGKKKEENILITLMFI